MKTKRKKKRNQKKEEKIKKRSAEKMVLPEIELGTFDAPDHKLYRPRGTHNSNLWKFYYLNLEPY